VAGAWSTGSTTFEPGSQAQGSSGALATPDAPSAGSLEYQSRSVFDERSFTPMELSALKAVARARGTYFRGSVAFDATRPLPDGLIFVDTLDGRPISEATSLAELATVSVGTGAGTGLGGAFRGWIVANGSVSIGGSIAIEGLVYAADRFTQTGTARLTGVAMAGHVRSTTPSLVDARPGSGPALVASCEAGRTGGGKLPQRWLVKPGSYREAAG
jgi:hypothetical protein